MRIRVNFSLDNEDFQPPDEASVALNDIFTRLCEVFDDGARGGVVRDTNGNTVGDWAIVPEEDDDIETMTAWGIRTI
jgi:hypothetical protein